MKNQESIEPDNIEALFETIELIGDRLMRIPLEHPLFRTAQVYALGAALGRTARLHIERPDCAASQEVFKEAVEHTLTLYNELMEEAGRAEARLSK